MNNYAVTINVISDKPVTEEQILREIYYQLHEIFGEKKEYKFPEIEKAFAKITK